MNFSVPNQRVLNLITLIAAEVLTKGGKFMRSMFSKKIHFRSEPYSKSCPRCNVLMGWSSWQGRLGGWECPKCGLKIDYK